METFTSRIGQVFAYEYDSLNRIVKITGAGGAAKRYSYDAVGNVTGMTDENGNTTTYAYTPTGKLAKVVDALGNESAYTYDACGRLIEVSQSAAEELSLPEELQRAMAQNAENNQLRVTRYERNANGQVVATTDALGQTERYSYDMQGQLVEKLDKDGYLTRFGYTARGDLNHIQHADGREVKLSYNPLRQLTEMEDWLGLTKIDLDPLGRTTKVTNHQDKAVSYTWGSAGTKTGMTYPDGTHVSYEYDDLLRLNSVNDGANTTRYQYDAYGRLTEKLFPSGKKAQYQYNNLGRLQSLSHIEAYHVLDRYQYAYDAMGNKIEVHKTRDGFPEENGVYSYTYDPLNRLQAVLKDGKPLRSYEYDGYGNRAKMTEGETQTTYAYNAANQLVFTSDNLGMEQRYTYDKRGNLTEVFKNDALANAYHFGALNRLEQALNHETGLKAAYRYNGLGHRVGKSEAAMGPTLPTVNMTKQIDDVLDLTRQFNNLLERQENEAATIYVWDGSLLSAMSGHRSQEYLLDDLGSPIRVGRFKGYGYDEFGNSLYDAPGAEQPFGFTGYQTDAVAGTWYAQAREYDAQSGRFVSEDVVKGTIQLPLTMNHYAYCWNRPLDYVDLNGQFPWMLIPLLLIPLLATGCSSSGDSSSVITDVTDIDPNRFQHHPFEPDRWNNDFPVGTFPQPNNQSEILRWNTSPVMPRTNCYAYAFNFFNNPITGLPFQSHAEGHFALQPGDLAAIPWDPSWTGSDGRGGTVSVNSAGLIEAVRRDALAAGLTFSPLTFDSQGGFVVALVVMPPNARAPWGDYHWYRLNADGTWSHKQGALWATDQVGFSSSDEAWLTDIIRDPIFAAYLLGYTEFLGFFMISEDCGG